MCIIILIKPIMYELYKNFIYEYARYKFKFNVLD